MDEEKELIWSEVQDVLFKAMTARSVYELQPLCRRAQTVLLRVDKAEEQAGEVREALEKVRDQIGDAGVHEMRERIGREIVTVEQEYKGMAARIGGELRQRIEEVRSQMKELY